MEISVSTAPNVPMYFFTVSLYNSVLTDADLSYVLDQIVYQAEYIKLAESPRVPMPPATYPYFVTAPIEELHKDFYVKVFQLLLKKGLFFQTKRRDPALRFRKPDTLAKLINLDLGNEQMSQVQLLQEFEKVIQYSPHYGHPIWLFQLTAGYTLEHLFRRKLHKY